MARGFWLAEKKTNKRNKKGWRDEEEKNARMKALLYKEKPHEDIIFCWLVRIKSKLI